MERKATSAPTGQFARIAVVLALLVTVFRLSGFAQPANTVLLETWTGIGAGIVVTDLTNNANYPNTPTTRTYPTLFEQPTTTATNLGTRMRAFITPPTTGVYNFFIACDDACQLLFSTTDNSAGRTVIASSAAWTNPREWAKNASQKSANITLTAGERYYIETLHKQGAGGGNVAVGWQGPGITADAERPIPGSRLMPFQLIPAPAVTTQPGNKTVTAGQTASFTVIASGSGLTYRWIKNGVIIPGATSDTYTTPATVSADNGAIFIVKISNAAGSATSANSVLTVNATSVAPTITTPATSPLAVAATVGTSYNYTVVATGTTPITYSATGLPPPLVINASTGVISGTPTTAGPYNATVTASNGVSPNASKVLSFNVSTNLVAPTITTPATSPLAVTATVGAAYSYTVTATGTTPITYSATGLPPPLVINASTGVISGTPTTAGPYNATVTASNGVSPNASKVLSFNVSTTLVAPTITTPATSPLAVTATVGAPYSYTVTANGTTPITFSATGLPPPLVINASTGVISGTPTTAGPYNATVTASNGVSPNASKVLSFNVNTGGGTPVITTQPVPVTALIGTTATFTVAATGTSLTYQWKKNGVNVPSGGTAATYTTPAVTTADDGAIFTCTVSSGALSTNTDGLSKLIVEFRAGKLSANDVVALRVNATEVVTTPQWEIPDYVFEKDYQLKSLADLERYVATHKHLPEMPSAKDIRARGMNLSEMNVQLLKNVEELTLRLISLQKEMKDKDARLQQELDALRSKLGNR